MCGIIAVKGGVRVHYNVRLVKCYKFKIVFHVWETLDDAGNVIEESVCPHVFTYSDRQFRPKCNGLNEWGKPCYFASWPRPPIESTLPR